MSEDTDADTDESPIEETETLVAAAINDPYKVLGDLSNSSGGIGVLGRNTASNGTTKGVEGRVESPDGYGLYTPDDALLKGTLDTDETDFVVEAGTTTTSDATNVVLGHASNLTTAGVVGATIGGGGYDDGGTGGSHPNAVTDDYGTVGGGRDNLAGDARSGTTSARYATVGGGRQNRAGAAYATVAGGGPSSSANPSGTRNAVFDAYGTVGGGGFNRAGSSDSTSNATYATVSGGQQNAAKRKYSTIGGGFDNTADGESATVGGGNTNEASGRNATVGGGTANATSSDDATIAGGRNNNVYDRFGAVGGGNSNQAGEDQSESIQATYATVGGGGDNKARGKYSTVGGGEKNQADRFYATVGGGQKNATSGWGATIAGGMYNTASTSGATVSGGTSNAVTGVDGAVGGGMYNSASASGATVSGGTSNAVTGVDGAVGGGRKNRASDEFAAVAGGSENAAIGVGTAVGGGEGNTASVSGATISGGTSNIANAVNATVAGGRSNWAKAKYATVAGGDDNRASGQYSFAAGRGAQSTDDGSFVWADSTSGTVSSTTGDTFIVSATNGVGINTTDPEAPLDIRGGNSNLANSGGDLKIGTDDHRLNVGVTTSGTFRGLVEMRAESTNNPQLRLGVGTDNICVVDDSAVRPTGDGTYDLGTSSYRWKEVFSKNGVTTTSDARLKTNVADVEDGPDLIGDLRPVRYEWAGADEAGGPAGEDEPKTRLGLIAQEVADVVPEAVVEPDDGGYLGMHYDSLIPLLVDAVQQQGDRIDRLEAELASVRERLDGGENGSIPDRQTMAEN